MSAKRKAIGISDFLNKKFDSFHFDGAWKASFGEPEKNFKMVVYGNSGNGKTDFCVKLAKYLSRFGKVYYNSFEEGVSKTLQDAFVRNDMREVTGRVIVGDRENFTDMMQRLGSRNSPHFVVIDSRDYMKFTTEQYKMLTERHHRKSLIVVCWEMNSAPRGEHGKQMLYMCDIKVHVKNFVAIPRCRYGGNGRFTIWERPLDHQEEAPNLFNQTQQI